MADRREQLLRDAAAVDLGTATADRHWLPELDDLGRQMDEVEDRIDRLTDRLLPSYEGGFDG